MHWGDNDLLIDSFPSPVILGLGLGFLKNLGGETKLGRVKESLFKKKRFPPTHPYLSHSHGRKIKLNSFWILHEMYKSVTSRWHVFEQHSKQASDITVFVVRKHRANINSYSSEIFKSFYARRICFFKISFWKFPLCKLRLQSFFQKEFPLNLL